MPLLDEVRIAATGGRRIERQRERGTRLSQRLNQLFVPFLFQKPRPP